MLTRTEVRTCDRCGATTTSVNGEPEPMELMEVGIGLRFERYATPSYPSSAPTAYWCRGCCIAMGLLPKIDSCPPVKPPDAAPTMEDFIRQIVREEIQQ